MFFVVLRALISPSLYVYIYTTKIINTYICVYICIYVCINAFCARKKEKNAANTKFCYFGNTVSQ